MERPHLELVRWWKMNNTVRRGIMKRYCSPTLAKESLRDIIHPLTPNITSLSNEYTLKYAALSARKRSTDTQRRSFARRAIEEHYLLP